MRNRTIRASFRDPNPSLAFAFSEDVTLNLNVYNHPLVNALSAIVDSNLGGNVESVDYSSCVERLEAMEDRLGVELSSVGAATDCADQLYVRGEISSKDRGRLANPVVIQVAVYNSAGQIIASGDARIDNKTFCGFDIFEIHTGTDLPDVQKIRVWPKVDN